MKKENMEEGKLVYSSLLVVCQFIHELRTMLTFFNFEEKPYMVKGSSGDKS